MIVKEIMQFTVYPLELSKGKLPAADLAILALASECLEQIQLTKDTSAIFLLLGKKECAR